MHKKRDFKLFAHLMGLLALNFTDDDNVSPRKIDLYWQAFQGIDIEDFKAAVFKLIKLRPYRGFPAIGEIWPCLPGGVQITASDARAQIENWLYNGGPEPDHPLIKEIIKSYGGWYKLGMTPYPQLRFVLNDLESRFEALTRRGEISLAAKEPQALPKPPKKLRELGEKSLRDISDGESGKKAQVA